jgi:hypothetical protein
MSLSPGFFGVEVFVSGSCWHRGLHLRVFLAQRSLSLRPSNLHSRALGKTSCSGVASPPVHFPSLSWLALVIESSATLGVVDLVIVVEVDVSEPLELEWLMKV